MKSARQIFSRFAAFILLEVAVSLASCGKQSGELPTGANPPTGIAITDGAGRSVEFAGTPQRIVSLSPAATDILVAVQADGQMVGATRYCVIPANDEKRVERIGGVMDPDYEAIVALKPDLVVAPWLADKTLQDKLAALGLPLLVLHPEGLQGTIDDIRMVGRATGHAAAGEAKAKAIENIRALAEGRWKDVPPQKRPRVLIYMDDSCPAPGSYVDDLLTAAGGRNVLPHGNKAWVEVTPESALQLAPDLVIQIPSGDAATPNAAMPEFKGLAKVETIAPGEVFYHPGPTVGQALWKLARAIDPARFPEAAPPTAP